MRLKALEIKGFKSFADKTVLHFNNNMTGIVGNNGCGKSNTVDAIRWVLGEQKSKSLRSEKMEQLIFSGTSKRKASGRAEVSLTFENTKNLLPTEFATITVTRIYYRTGESEYRLNNVRCRLKDIHNLFMDTGISSDSYAIIELKMIDEILNDKDHSRRKLFEQAAGVSKFKVRKKESLQRLKSTEADLARVEDLLFEIEGNLRTLERQAKRTRRYHKLKEQYKLLSVELIKHQLQQYKGDYKSLKANITTENDRLLSIITTIDTLEASMEKDKAKALELEQLLNKVQKALNDNRQQLNKKENRKNLVVQQSKFLEERQERLTQSISESETQIRVLSANHQSLVDQEAEEAAYLEQYKTAADTAQQAFQEEQVQFNQIQKQVKTLRSSQRQTEQQIFSIEKQIAVKQAQQSNFVREIQQNKIRFESREKEWQTLLKDQEVCQKEQEKLQGQLTEVQALRKDLQAQIEAEQSRLIAEKESLQSLLRELDARKNEHKLTKSLVDSLEDFPESIQFLEANHHRWNHQAPLLVDIIDCQETYKLAIENYLKPFLNTYVVNTLAEAQSGIQLLENSGKGKAQFFILEELSSDHATPATSNAALIHAPTVVKVQEAHQDLVNHLLNHVFIVPTNQEASEDMLENGNIYLYQDGRIIRQQNTISGGSVGAYEGKRIGRKQQLEALEKAIEDLESQVKTVKNNIQQFNQSKGRLENTARKHGHSIKNLHKQLDKQQKKLLSYQLKVNNLEQLLGENNDKESDLSQHIEKIEAALLPLQQQLNELGAERDSNQKQLSKEQEAVEDMEQAVRKARSHYNDLNLKFHQQTHKIKSIRQNFEFKQQQLKETKERLKNQENRLQQSNEEADTLLTEKLQLLDELDDLYDTKETVEKRLEQVETAYYKQRGATSEQEKELKQHLRQKEQANLLVQELKDKQNRLQMELLSIKERLQLEFSLAINDLMNEEPETDREIAELDAKVTKIKGQIDRFGEINPFAVEAFEEMNERYSFIKEQREDLLNAKGSLLDTMKQIEDTATKQFLTAFEQIRTNFIKVFHDLFTDGDQCDLKLADPEKPLESAIQIMAKPKGKRPQTINQLSGGEKSLTALAMVFALYLLKPAPFCILDEVDAPLDDANVGKFTKIIRQFSENSQFILVTHNKNTMAAVDTIFGVVMSDKEPGISKVVPVDFRYLDELLG